MQIDCYIRLPWLGKFGKARLEFGLQRCQQSKILEEGSWKIIIMQSLWAPRVGLLKQTGIVLCRRSTRRYFPLPEGNIVTQEKYEEKCYGSKIRGT